MRPPERFADLPGRSRVRWRGSAPAFVVLACLAGAAWPPLILTLPVWPPESWAGNFFSWPPRPTRRTHSIATSSRALRALRAT